MKILIAEDDSVSRTLLEENLKGWGYDVITAPDGETAVRKFNDTNSISLAILDWMMPGISGIEVCQSIRKNQEWPYTYIIMLTAKSETSDIIHALQNGADDYVTKPFNAAELRARLSAGERVVGLQATLKSKITELEDALTHIKQLHGLLPICMHCKKIRDDQNTWQQMEEYISQRTEAEFSHSICSECEKKYFPEYSK